MSILPPIDFPEECAVIGKPQVIPGQVARFGDPLKHLGPPPPTYLWPITLQRNTRCGLALDEDGWYLIDSADHVRGAVHDDDVWCPECLKQAGIIHRVEKI